MTDTNGPGGLVNAKFYNVEKFTIGHVSVAGSFTCASV